MIQVRAGEAWIALTEGRKAEALSLMNIAADMEDSTSKHPVTPSEVLPARELYADMLLQLQHNEKAFMEYEKVLQKSPNRFNSLYGAGVAAEKSGITDKAVFYYKQLLSVAETDSHRPELLAARVFLNRYKG